MYPNSSGKYSPLKTSGDSQVSVPTMISGFSGAGNDNNHAHLDTSMKPARNVH